MQFQFCMGTKQLFMRDDPGQNMQLLHIKNIHKQVEQKVEKYHFVSVSIPASRDTQISSQKERKESKMM